MLATDLDCGPRGKLSLPIRKISQENDVFRFELDNLNIDIPGKWVSQVKLYWYEHNYVPLMTGGLGGAIITLCFKLFELIFQ